MATETTRGPCARVPLVATVPIRRSPSQVPPRDTDTDAVARVKAGDVDAFEVLVVRHRDLAVRIAAGIVGRDEAEDVVQDAFLRALHRIELFRGDAPFKVWMMRIVHNTAINTLEKRRPTPVETVEEHEAGPDAEALSPISMVERSEARQLLAGKITQLRPEHRAVLVLRDIEGLSYSDIAEVVKVPVGTVKGRLHRARAELVDLLRHNSYDWELPADASTP